MANDERPKDEQPKDKSKKKRIRLCLALSMTNPFHLCAYEHLKSQKNMTDYMVRLIINDKDKRKNVIEPAPAFASNEEKLIWLIKKALSESKEENYISTAPIQSESDTSLLQENEDLKRRNSSLLEQNTSLQNERDELEKQLATANAETAKLRSQCASMKSQYDAACAEAAQYRELARTKLQTLFSSEQKPVTPTQPTEKPKEDWVGESLSDLNAMTKDAGGDVNA